MRALCPKVSAWVNLSGELEKGGEGETYYGAMAAGCLAMEMAQHHGLYKSSTIFDQTSRVPMMS